MPIIDGRTWLEHLSEPSCWELLAAAPVGRVVVLVDGRPEIYPVNHQVDGHTIVFRTDPGSKLRGLDDAPATCFEVDGIDPDTQTGWSVMVKGRAERVTDRGELTHLAELPLELWTSGPKAHWVRVRPRSVTGRRIHLPEAAGD